MVLGFGLFGQSQEMDELKLNLEKLAQLKLMLSQMKQGYTVLQNGYNSVRNAAQGNFDLHKQYLNAQLQVSDQVRNTPALQRMLTNQSAFESEYKQWVLLLQGLGLITANEWTETVGKFQRIESQARDDLDQLQRILSNGDLRMSDAERISAIESLADKSDKYLGSVRVLIKEQNGLMMNRAQQKKDVVAMKRLYGL